MKLIFKIIAFLICFTSCTKEIDSPLEKISVYNPLVISYDSTLCGGSIAGDYISSFGVCYSTHSLPTIHDRHIEGRTTFEYNQNGKKFSCDLIQLDPDTKYYIRSYAKQGKKTITYSSELNFINTPTMVFVKGSTSINYPFLASNNIELTGFYIDKFEITNDRYCQFINANKYLWGESTYNGNMLPTIGVEIINNPDSKILYNSKIDTFYVKSGFENHPVVYLNLSDAVAYADNSQGRLPTDAEWIFAARGGNLSLGYSFAGSNNLNEVAWNRENSNLVTHEVGQKKSNELGLFDMTGNAGEWILDYFSFDTRHYYDRPNKDPLMIFSKEWCDNNRMTAKGGSCGTSGLLNYDRQAIIAYDKLTMTGLRLVYSKAKLNKY